MELVEQSVTGLFLAEGAMPLSLDHEALPETSLDDAVHAHSKDKTMTVQITCLEGQKLEFPIPLERIIEPISPAEVPLEESELAMSSNEATMEEFAGSDDPKDHQVQCSLNTCLPNEIMAATDSILDSTPIDPCSEFKVQTDHTEDQVDSTVVTALYPDTLLDPSCLAEEAQCENGNSEGSTLNSASSNNAGNSKSVRKKIPPKKDRMDPLKMDMSKPTVIPLTSSQLSLQCLECHIIFSDDKSKQRHLKMNHPTEYEQFILGDSFFACYVCDRHFTCSTELMAHQRTHTEKQPFKCPICGEAFSRSSELTNHKKVHLSKHGYDCPDCGKTCKTLTLLKYHQRIHTGERPYVCLYKGCGKRFSMPKAAQKHQEAHNRGEAGSTKKKSMYAKNYACSQCDESFRTAKSQLLHIQTKHTQSKTITLSSSSVAGQELNGNPHDATQPQVVQPAVLRMEAIGPAPQIGPLGAEQIKRLIEKLGNVQKVNQLVILGVDQIQNTGTQQPQRLIQPLHFNFTEPTSAQSVEDQQTRDQTEEQRVHKETVSVTTNEATCRESLEVGVTVEQEETMVQEERANNESLLSLNPEEQVAAAESDMAVAQLNEVQLEFVSQLTEQSVVIPSQLEMYHENIQIIQEQSIEVASGISTLESGDLSSLISTNNCESSQYQTIEEEHVTMSTDLMAAEETITHEESLGKHRSDDLLVETETHITDDCQDLKEQSEQLCHMDQDLKEQSEQLSQKNQDLKEQSEQLSQNDLDFKELSKKLCHNDSDFKELSGKLFHKDQDLKEQSEQLSQTKTDQESSHLEQESSNKTDTQPRKVVMSKHNMANVRDCLPKKKLLPKKKKSAKKQVIQKSQHLEPQKEVAKSTLQMTPKKKKKKPSKTVPKKREKAKSKKLSNLQTTEKNQVLSGPKEKVKEKSPKQQNAQISKNIKYQSLLKDQKDYTADKVPVSLQNNSAPQLQQKNQKSKKGKTGENSSGLLKTFNVANDPKEPNVPEQTPRGKTPKKKNEKQKDLVKKRKSQETLQDETPTPKKKKPSKPSESVSPKKAKVKNGTVKEQSKEIQKLSKQGEKEQKSVSPTSSPDQIKQQALLLLKGHKQPQLKVHKLDAKVTGLEQPPKPKSQIKEACDQEAKVVKAKGGKQKKVLQTASQKKKKAKTLGKDLKKKKDDPHFSLAPIDSVTDSALLQTKPKVPRKRKAPTKIDQEIALSPPFSRLIIGCHDCGTKFSEVSALQEHMASMHSENGLLQSSVSCDVPGNLMMSPRSNELALTNSLSVHPHDFEIQVASDWDMETEMRGIGLGDVDVHRLSFPALSSSPSLPMTSNFPEGEGKILGKGNEDMHSERLETIGEESIEHAQDFMKVKSGHIQTNDKESARMFESDPPSLISGPQENMDIKEELPSDVNLVMVEDQSEGDVPTQVNSLLNDCPENSTGQQKEDESSHSILIHTATSPQNQLPAKNGNSTSQNTDTQTEIKHEEEEMLVHGIENQPKTSMARSRKGRSGRGRGKRQFGKRSASENEGTKELRTDKEECQVVFQMYSLSDDEEKNEGQRQIKSVNTAHSRLALEKSPKGQAISDSQPVATRVAEELQVEYSSQIQKSGQQVRNGTSSAVMVEKFSTPQERKEGRMRKQGNPQPDIEGHTSTGTSTDVKIETSAAVQASHDVHPNERDLLRGVQVFLVKAEDHEPHVLQGIQDMQTTHATEGIPSGSSTVSQSAGKQCIFYPVKEEEREILVEPVLSKPGVPDKRTGRSGSWAASGLEECEEVQMGCTQMEMHYTVYSSVEEDDVGTEQQSTTGFLEFLSQSSDTEDTDNFQSDPEAETHVMSCYDGIRINRSVQQHEMSRNRSSNAEHQGGRNKSWKPIDYFIQYFCWNTWKEIAECTGKLSKLPEPVTEKEVSQFVGIHIAMGTLKFPSMKLYWEDCTRVPLIADAMLSSRFSELASNLRLAAPNEDSRQNSPDQLDVTGETSKQIPAAGEKSKMSSQLCGNQGAQNCTNISKSKTDPLWKVQVLVNRVQEGCRALKRQGNHGVDQYPLPFQRHPTHSLHHTVMISVTGLVMDFNLRINDSDREDVVGKMVIQEKDDNQGMIFLCKPELSTPSMLEHLLDAGVRSAGKVGGSRGHVGDEFVTSDGKLKLFRCHHGFILSAVTKEKSRSTSLVSGFERAIKAVNLNRDLRSLYRTPCTSASPSAWPLSVLWDLIDLALVNSWLQYKDDHRIPEPLSLMDFRLEVSKALILPSSTAQESSAPQPPAPSRPSSNSHACPSDDFDTPLPDADTRYDGLGHWPEQLAEGEEARCRFGGCERTSRVRCLKCCVFLCISRNHNCFLKFHSQGAA